MRYAVSRARKNANAHPDGSGPEVLSVGHPLLMRWVLLVLLGCPNREFSIGTIEQQWFHAQKQDG
jgi:hypothetical protein